jgi:hypothetical protein
MQLLLILMLILSSCCINAAPESNTTVGRYSLDSIKLNIEDLSLAIQHSISHNYTLFSPEFNTLFSFSGLFLGAGNNGAVFAATYNRKGKSVALKFGVSRTLLTNCSQIVEVLILETLRNAKIDIIPYYGCGFEIGRFFYIMQAHIHLMTHS